MAGGIADRAVARAAARAAEAAEARAREEIDQLVDAGLTLLRRDGAAAMTIADVLAEAGLSTRAFYRHFDSKSDLLLAIYEREVERYRPRLQRRLDAAGSPMEALVAWIDELLATGFSPGRQPRTRAMFGWAAPLQQEFPAEFAAIRTALTDPLEAVLAAGRADGTFPTTDPGPDARFIRALTWELVDQHLGGAALDVVGARELVLRFCLPALGAEAPARA